MDLASGEKIVVYNSERVELGEGTLIRVEHIPEMKMTVYECQEHAILAKSPHFVKKDGTLFKVE